MKKWQTPEFSTLDINETAKKGPYNDNAYENGNGADKIIDGICSAHGYNCNVPGHNKFKHPSNNLS